MLIRIGDVVCLWYEGKKSNQAQSPLCSVNTGIEIFLTKIYFMKTYHTSYYVHIWKFRSFDVGLRGWIRIFWMGKSVCTRHLIFLNAVSVAIYDCVLCGRERKLISYIPCLGLSIPSQYHMQHLLTENTKLNFMFRLIFTCGI